MSELSCTQNYFPRGKKMTQKELLSCGVQLKKMHDGFGSWKMPPRTRVEFWPDSGGALGSPVQKGILPLLLGREGQLGGFHLNQIVRPWPSWVTGVWILQRHRDRVAWVGATGEWSYHVSAEFEPVSSAFRGPWGTRHCRGTLALTLWNHLQPACSSRNPLCHCGS